jgi:hypothetical protein
MMTLLASLHAIAAQRGDGLRPELIHLLEKPTVNFGTGPAAEHPRRDVTRSTARTESDPVSADATAVSEGVPPE